MAPSKCLLYDIIDPDPRNIRFLTWMKIEEMMRDSGWFGELGRRYGFVSTVARPEIVVGYFAHEGQKFGIQYGEDKQPKDTSTESFEHLFFAIYTDTSQLLLQHRNIYGYTDLGLPVMRNTFLDTLTYMFRSVGVTVVGRRVNTESAGVRYTQEELHKFFDENRVFRVEVKGLNDDLIPDSDSPRYNLYNPKDDWNPITWGAVADTLKVGTKNIIFEAEKENARSSLNQGPLPKAFTRVGQIEDVQARNEEEKVVFRKRTSDAEISIALPSSPQIEHSLIETITRYLDQDERTTAWNKRMEQRDSEQLGGTMFESSAE